MDYIQFWTVFQKKVESDSTIKKVFDDSRNDTGRGKDKNSYVLDFNVENGSDKIPYCLTLQINTRAPFISVDMYFRKKTKHAEEVLEFFLKQRDVLEKRLGKPLYTNDLSKGEVRMSLRNNLSEFDLDKADEYYDWFIANMLKMQEVFEGIRKEKGFYPERRY